MTEAPATPRTLLKVSEAAEQLRVSRSQIYMLIRAGLLGCIRLRSHTGSEGAIRVPQSAIDAFIEGNRESAAGTPS